MLLRLIIPGFSEIDHQIAKLRELRDSFRASNENRSYSRKEPHAFFPPTKEP
ncbi:hypothetical protein GeomeDRAFT_0374 [Geobacter metallireducens RCH3]|uniref:Uncharacterized protein n=1 Tax=Geobacter metallireducens (strain ATCC 53774 / DSM 7210 / GS-15) TaxID=269799 RepID=J7LWD2_GEOMG|nr:hypothetical protein [Geobacter metallireducens]AFR42840.1 hypothetical protein Gmet_3622 [Geobacter metallireducens GS-15]EHP88942.1 hypothetical protein GeomeDRAFT_0374 [Geobacter metallireducens RCH3]